MYIKFLLLLIFLLGLYFYAKGSCECGIEGFTNSKGQRCPDMLIQKGSKFYLYNSKVAQVPGVNPIEFNNLEDYTEFLDWQRSQNIRCPVLYLQETYDAQGNRVYKTRPSVSEPQGGLPPMYPNQTKLVDSMHNDKDWNINSYPGYDQTSYYVGTTTPLDEMNIYQQTENVISPNPMDSNWGGAGYTQSLIDSGYYKANEVNIAVA